MSYIANLDARATKAVLCSFAQEYSREALWEGEVKKEGEMCF